MTPEQMFGDSGSLIMSVVTHTGGEAARNLCRPIAYACSEATHISPFGTTSATLVPIFSLLVLFPTTSIHPSPKGKAPICRRRFLTV
jgi:hypothetical protein